MYRGLLYKWQNRTRPELDDPSNHCLAIARDVFCAHAFRRCRDFENPKQPLCEFMCDLLILRCSKEKELHE